MHKAKVKPNRTVQANHFHAMAKNKLLFFDTSEFKFYKCIMYNIKDKYSIWDLLKITVIIFFFKISFPII